MKSAMIVVLVAGLTLVSGVSAMTMTDGAMMAGDKMMTGSMDKAMMKDDKMMTGDAMMKKDNMMMKDNKMMMSDDAKMMAKKYVRMSTAALAKSMGHTWSTDRAMLAEKAGVTDYKGTIKQNLKIRTYLMGMSKDKMMMMKDSTMMKDTMAK